MQQYILTKLYKTSPKIKVLTKVCRYNIVKVTKEKTKGKHAMGMAAGQARLLSITSRLADNELRAQIINNNKMRLATESSQVSEAYVQALNDAQLMFTNYGADNSVNYQQLTFNAMTAYNPYNNQYILRNNAGNILVSETDAKNYEEVKNKPNALELFLGKYGLKYTTNYFNKLQTGANVLAEFGNYAGINNGNVYFYAGDVDGDGKISVGDYQDSGFTQAAIQALYEGSDDVTFLNGVTLGPSTTPILESYADTLASDKYYTYFAALDKYTEKQDIYYQCIADLMDAKLDTLVENHYFSNNDGDIKSIKILEDKINAADINYFKKGGTEEFFNDIKGILTEANKLTPTNNRNSKGHNPFIQTLLDRAEAYANGTATTFDHDEDTATDPVDGLNITKTINDSAYNDFGDVNSVKTVTYTSTTDSAGKTIETPAYHEITTGEYEIIEDDEDCYIVIRTGTPGSYTYTAYSATKVTEGSDTFYAYSTSTENTPLVLPTNPFEENGDGTCKLMYNEQVTLEDVKSEAVDILEALKNSIYKIWDPTNPDLRNISGVSQDVIDRVNKAYSEYIEAAAELGNCIYGAGSYELVDTATGIPAKGDGYYDKITPKNGYPEIEYLDNISLLYNATGGQGDYDGNGDGDYTDPDTDLNGKTWSKFDNSFYNVYKNILLDNIFASNGEPLYAWVDTNDSNENGEAKYNWYKNLFEQMSKGKEVVTNGLASSPEWMKFAFESGMVTIEQLDSFGNWNRTIYTNCSDITEQTNDKAIAIAEAEYNAAMNKIENKDKRYDLELKNIDTEHNSLQTEYDSIKTAINKNIERTFKIYS